MNILSITAQKPDSTGSGIFLKELVNCFHSMGHRQAVIAGIDPDDRPAFPPGVHFYPVCFRSAGLPFDVAGMSDEMPYPSTRYRDMTETMTAQFEAAFLETIRQAVNDFDPDVILCHHLYLLTALVREACPERTVCGFCHNTDLRQMKKHDLEHDRIVRGICGLDHIFVLRKDQIPEIRALYGADPARMTVTGTGYNPRVFCPGPNCKKNREKNTARLLFAGKISEKKGVPSLIRSLSAVKEILDRSCPNPPELSLTCAGGGSEDELSAMRALAAEAPCPVIFTGRVSQQTLADHMRQCDVFVLPSFSEGIPLAVIEALACGAKAVVSDLPGLQDWFREYVSGGDIRFVRLPEFLGTDEPVPDELPGFELRLAEAVAGSILSNGDMTDVTALRWDRIAEIVMKTAGSSV